MDQVYHEPATPTVTARPALRPYEYIATPPITLVLEAIAAHCGVGGCITPGVRTLADWAGVSQGQITPCLRQLAADGWIHYDGRVIMLLRSPDQDADQLSDQDADRDQVSDHSTDQDADRDQMTDRSSDQDADRPLDQDADRPLDQDADRDQDVDRPEAISPLIGAVQRVLKRHSQSDQAADRFSGRMEDHDLAAAGDQDSAAATKNLPCAAQNDQAADRLSPETLAAVRALVERDADDKIITDALTVRPMLTAAEVCDTWDWYEARRAAGDVREGAFFHAIRQGRVHAAPPGRDRPIDVGHYTNGAYSDLFRRGGDVSDLQEATEQ